MKIVTIENENLKQPWFFQIWSSNGKLLAHATEHYTELDDMADTIKSMQEQLPTAEVETKYIERKQQIVEETLNTEND